ncbi:MAG: GNAT family N-acetyltransferase [Chloroflexi bacterium]|nr:GNAT family N-acetyltransferase [Chloroflexota bacterium]MBU1746979.1 GNAT family N-acetyltransferase [Chloroflexota bacterium]MBU1878465.1 GNAT family N-acetyltransferase [Chloroflexota bacterium]
MGSELTTPDVHSLETRDESAAPRWRLHDVCPEDAPAVCRLFEECFGQPMSPALWEWKYGSGRGHGVWCEWSGEMVGHVGVMQRQIVWQGQIADAGQFGDVMVRADQRGGLHDLHFLLASTIGERHVGHGSAYPLGFAFSFEKLRHFYEHRGLAIRIGRMVQHEWRLRPSRRNVRWTSRPLDLTRDAVLVDHLWEAMRADLAHAIVGVRDAAYLAHRYRNHPAIAYQMHLVYRRWPRQSVGAIVLKLEPERAVLVDVVGAVRHFPVLVAQARRLAYQAGKPALHAWIDSAHAQWLASADAHSQDLDVLILHYVWTSTPDIETVRDAWWLTMGDTDYL